jgi:hypothetical protein
MSEQKTALESPEIFVRLGTETGTGKLVVDGEPCFAVEEIANKAFEYLLQGYDEEQIELVLTTHGRNATEECQALLQKIREINSGLVNLGFRYRLYETVAQNEERLRYCRSNDYPQQRQPSLFSRVERRGFY